MDDLVLRYLSELRYLVDTSSVVGPAQWDLLGGDGWLTSELAFFFFLLRLGFGGWPAGRLS